MLELEMSTLKPDLRKLLLIGNPGTGKTNFLKTMPKPIYVFSFDKGYATLAGEDGIKVGLCMDENRYAPKAYAEFKQRFEALVKGEKFKWPDGREEPYQTIALDNITFMSTMLYDHLQRVNNNIDKPGGYAVYGLVKSYMKDVINKAITIANYVVCTALVEVEKDDTTGEIFYKPSAEGSIRNELGAWFDAVFFMTVDKTPQGEKQYKLITVGERRQQAKVRLPSKIANSIAAVEVPDFGLLMKKIDAAIAKQS